MERGLADCDAVNCKMNRSYFLSLLARALELAGRYEEAFQAIDRGLLLMDETNERFCEAELHRVKGALMLAGGSKADAVACLERAVAVASGQSAKSLELRAATALARLWADQGERGKAHDLLVATYDWFTEGFDMPDLKDAKALLAELR